VYKIQNNENSLVSEPPLNETEKKIIELLKTGVFPANKIVQKLNIDWSSKKVSIFLKNREEIIIVNGKPLKYSHKSRAIQKQKTLFD
jgi:hypothetical protein